MHRRTQIILAGLGAAVLTAALPAGPAWAASGRSGAEPAVKRPGLATSTAWAAAAGQQQATSAPSGPTVVVKGLNNPRQIAATDAGSLLVAEAGSGGTTCVPVPGGETASETCIGFTGSISWVPLPSLQQNSSPVR